MHILKIAATIAAIHFSLGSSAQNNVFNKDSIAYTITDSNLSAGKTDLHRKAQGWVIDNLGNEKDIVRLDDMDTGELTGEATIDRSTNDSTTMVFRVSSRDRQYECEIHSIKQSSKEPVQPGGRIDKKIRSLLGDLHQRMRNDKNFAKPSVDTIPKL
jgi:hypothetical protein